MYGQNKVDSFDTINLCNQFLILYLAKKAQAFQNRGLSNNSRVYRNAITSIKRYPLPLICKEQLESINGIGEFLGQQLEKVIKNHYSAFLDSKFKPTVNENEVNQYLIMNEQLSGEKVETEKEAINLIREQRNLQKQESIEIKQESNWIKQESNMIWCSGSKSNTVKSATSKYKPRINTANSYFLQVLSQLTMQQKHSQGNIAYEIIHSQIIRKYPGTKNRTWKLLEQTLELNDYITIQRVKQESKQQTKYYRLTAKGARYNKSLEQKSKQNQAKDRIINQVREFKENISSINNKQPSSLNTFCLNSPAQQHQQDKLLPKILECRGQQISLDKLVLMIDMREKNQKTESNFFIEKMRKKYGIKCESASLNLGDFLWVYDNKVLDYIIERKIADDLAASILDGRYKDQKYRLNQSSITNIYYIYQGYPSDNCCLTEKELNSALLKTRVKEKFKVCKTKDINQTMKLLNTFHLQIYHQITLNKVYYLSSFEQFNELNSIQRNFTVGKIFALGLMAIPGVGKNSVSVLTQYFKTYKSLYEYLSRFECNRDRVQFLKNLFKGSGVLNSLPGILVQLLFSQSYSNHKQQQANEPNIRYQTDYSQEYEQHFEKKRFSVIHEEQELNDGNDQQGLIDI